LAREGLPMEVQRLIVRHFEANTDVDVLLFAYRQRDRRLTAKEAAVALRIHPEQADRSLARMAATGLFRAEGTGYRYAPRRSDDPGAVEALAGLHPTYRLAIASLIFSGARHRVRGR